MATVRPQIPRFASNWDVNIKMFDILSELLDPSTISCSEEAARHINSLYFADHSLHTSATMQIAATGKFLMELWDLIFKIASQLLHNGSRQHSLISFIHAIRRIDTSHEFEGQKLWGGLPRLGMFGIEAFNDVAGNTPEEMNFQAFIALLTKENISNWAEFAMVEFRNILEKEPDPRSKAYYQQGPGIDQRMPYALLWLSLAGQNLFSNVLHGSTDTLDGGNLWKGKEKGFCMARWQLWKHRFGEISRFDQVSEQTKNLAREAEATMEALEKTEGL